MASPGMHLDNGQPQQDATPQQAVNEAQKWIEEVTGKSFGDKDFRSGLENGILLCELLNAIKPGLVKKINKLPTPIAGLDNITLFLRGCKEFGLKESQLFDPGDLQDTSNRVTVKGFDGNRKLKNVLVTIYWLGKAANNCTSYCGATLNLKEFEGLLVQMRKEAEDLESPKRSIRDSGYIDCWDSERSDSLSPPRHGRDDSFDSLDSFGSRSQQTPSPDVILRGSSDGRGSDSEPDVPHRKIPDVRKDDMSARRSSTSEPKAAMPFNQYLPNKNNPACYMPAPLRKKRAEREEYRKSWSTATSPLGGERPFRFNTRTAVSDDSESNSMYDMRLEDEVMQPHSRTRYEHLQNLHNQMKEEEDKWQDDLARWKSRRRSASQDLIKKEQERKKLERLMSGEEDALGRRKSIKTYREIVEEKERRESALHEAYKNAKTKEEAEKILQHYVQRFSISEAVLERLQMPKLLERSQSADSDSSSSSPTKDTDPLKYLRQQSLPTPKFTATVETTISSSAGWSQAERTSPSKVASKAVPVLTPKPYSQPKNAQKALKSFKVDGESHMNGHSTEDVNGVEEARECFPMKFSPSLSRSQMFEGVARVDKTPAKSIIESCTKKTVTEISQLNKYQTSGPREEDAEQLVSSHVPQTDQMIFEASSPTYSSTCMTTADATCYSNPETRTSIVLARTERKPDFSKNEYSPTKKVTIEGNNKTELPVSRSERAQDSSRIELPLSKTDYAQNYVTESPLSKFKSQHEDDQTEERVLTPERVQNHKRSDLLVVKNEGKEELDRKELLKGKPAYTSRTAEQEAGVVNKFLKTPPETDQQIASHSPSSYSIAESRNSERSTIIIPPLNLPKRFDLWSWDPEEERKRQERWQKEQERLLQEKYENEQKKLKAEWEKAQKEVEEEERRYHEEERKIIEETNTPLTPLGSRHILAFHDSQRTVEEKNESELAPRSVMQFSCTQEGQGSHMSNQVAEAESCLRKKERMTEDWRKWEQSWNRECDAISSDALCLEEKRVKDTQANCSDGTEKTSGQEEHKPHVTEHSLHVRKEIRFVRDGSWSPQPLTRQPQLSPDVRKKTASLDRNWSQSASNTGGMKRSGSHENLVSGQSPHSPVPQNSSSSRSVSGKKLCSTCGLPLGKGAAMIIETLSLYFHIQCFRCGICKGPLGDATTGTDVRIRNGLLNCNDCYVRSRTAGQPTTL